MGSGGPSVIQDGGSVMQMSHADSLVTPMQLTLFTMPTLERGVVPYILPLFVAVEMSQNLLSAPSFPSADFNTVTMVMMQVRGAQVSM